MLYNIKPLHLHCVFHGIRFKVNKDWLSGIDSLLFLYTPKYSAFYHLFFTFLHFYALFINLIAHPINENIIFASNINVKRETQI